MSTFRPLRLAPSWARGALRDAGPSVPLRVQGITYADHWLKIKAAFLAARGIAGYDDAGKPYPQTTVGDVLAVAAHYNREPIAALRRHDRRRWLEALDTLAASTAGQPETARYPHNRDFWQRDTRRLSLALGRLEVGQPSRFEMAWESLTESVAELPGRVGKASEVLGVSPATLALVAVGAVGAVALSRLLR